MVAHNCHGKRITVTSRQKEKDSRQKENLTAKRKRLTAKFLQCREDILILFSFAVRSWLLSLSWGYSFCRESISFCHNVFLFDVRSFFLREVNSFAVTVVGHRTFEILSTKILDFFIMCVFVRTNTNFAHLASFQAIEFVDWPFRKRWALLYAQYARQVKTKLSKRSILLFA